MKKHYKLLTMILAITVAFFSLPYADAINLKEFSVNQDRALTPYFSMIDTFVYNPSTDSCVYPDNYGGSTTAVVISMITEPSQLTW